MEVSSVDELKREYRLSTIIYIAMIVTVFVYAVVVELIKKNFAPFKGFAPFPEVYILRYVFLGLTIADFFLIKFIWRKLLSASTQKLIETSIITYALCESVAIYGLILFLAAGSSLDFYTFMILSLSFFGVYFPRYGHWKKWVKEGERSEDIREIRIGEEKAIFTKTEVTLAILLSIFIYTVLWSLGTLMGFFIPVWAVVSLPFIIVTIWKKIKGRRLRTIVISVFLALLVGHLSKIIILQLGGPAIFLLISIFLGGIVIGSISYKDFLQSMKKNVIKYGFSAFIVLGVLATAFIGLGLYYNRVDVPLEHVHPAEVASGWIVKSESQGLMSTEVKYEKGKSTLRIIAARFGGYAKTKKEYKNEADQRIKAIKLGLLAKEAGSKITAKLKGEEIGEVNGHPCYTLYYDIIVKRGDIDLKAVVLYYWYCESVQTGFEAGAIIRDSPTLEYISEVEEMVNSIKCHINPRDAEAYNNLGIAFGKLGRYEESLKASDKAIELKPDYAGAWYTRGCTYSLKGDKENALNNLSRSIDLDAKYKEYARKDEDFKNLWDDEDFKKVTR